MSIREVAAYQAKCDECGWRSNVLASEDEAADHLDSHQNTHRIAAQVLDLVIGENDAGARTVREYILRLGLGVWVEDEGFSGKRPFGNSSWWYEVCDAVQEAGLASDVDEARSVVAAAIRVEASDG